MAKGGCSLVKRTLLLVLVATALLLTAAKGNKEHQNQANTYDRGAAHKTKATTPAFTIIVQPAPVKVIQQSAAIEKKQPVQKWYQRPSATDGAFWGLLFSILSARLACSTLHDGKPTLRRQPPKPRSVPLLLLKNRTHKREMLRRRNCEGIFRSYEYRSSVHRWIIHLIAPAPAFWVILFKLSLKIQGEPRLMKRELLRTRGSSPLVAFCPTISRIPIFRLLAV